jgi:parvulin-like peptidyl-prolyl isomerase
MKMNMIRLNSQNFCSGAALVLSLSSLNVFAQTIDKTPPPPGMIAVVNGVAIPEARLQEAVQRSGQPDSAQLRSTLKNQLVSLELIHQQAAKNPAYEKRPEVKKAMQEAKDAAVTQIYLRDAIKPVPVTDEMVRAQFNTIVDSLGPNEYKARLIQVADDAAAKNILDQLKAGKDFDALARQFSLAPNKTRGSELDWVSFKLPVQEGKTQNLPLPIALAISQMPLGSVTQTPVVMNGARYIIRLDQLRPTQVPQYDAVKDTLRKTLELQSLERATITLVSGLVKTAKIQQ